MLKKELVVAADPKSPISENFRSMRTNLQFMKSSGEKQVILITSTLPSEGKSWVASNIAAAFAQTGKKTCIVDCDMRKGRLYALFDLLPAPGVSNYLSGVNVRKDDMDDMTKFMKETVVENLYFVPAGNVPPNPSELLILPRMKEFIEKLKQNADVIILDGTPCDLVTDSTIISRIVDQTILVCAYKTTKMEDLKETKRKIEHAGGKIVGVVFNKVPTFGKRYEDKYYYGDKLKRK